MTRKQFWLRLLGVTAPLAGAGPAAAGTFAGDECQGLHEWTNGPFFVSAARTTDEPRKVPPSGLVAVEHCTRCGAMRLPPAYRTFTGENMGEHD